MLLWFDVDLLAVNCAPASVFVPARLDLPQHSPCLATGSCKKATKQSNMVHKSKRNGAPT